MPGRLAKANSGVQYKLFPEYAAIAQSLDPFRKELADLADDIGIGGIELHGLRGALRMHAHVARPGFGGQPPHGLPLAIGRDVIDDAGSRGQRCLGDSGLGRVNRKRHFEPPGQLFDYRHHPAQFFGLRHWRGARARGFAAHINNLRPLFHQLQRMGHCCPRVQKPPAIIKRVRRDVHDAHHQRGARESELKLAAAQLHPWPQSPPSAPDRFG